MRGFAQPTGGKVTRGAQKPASKEAAAAVKLPPSPAAIEKALARIKAILGSWFYAEVKARNLIQKPEEIVQFAKLTDAQMLEIGPLLKRGWTFVAAFREVIERLTPDDEIRALHTRAVENGGNWCLLSVGNFEHLVMWGAEKEKLSPRLRTLWRGHPLRNDLNRQPCVGRSRIFRLTSGVFVRICATRLISGLRFSHFCSRKEECKAGFGALILIYSILMQRVATATRNRIVKRLPKIVATEKPFESQAAA